MSIFGRLFGKQRPAQELETNLPGKTAPLSSAAEATVAGTERYSLNSLHATGGIGRVWLARDTQMGRDVALKELRPEQAGNALHRARFVREAQITGQLAHPGIVPVYEMAQRPGSGQPFYTMRFVKGRTLKELAREYHQKRAAGQGDSIEFSNLLNAFVVVCKTIAYAHSRGVIHRDLKGENVVVGDFGEVVVLDWGLAKVVDQGDATPLYPPVGIERVENENPELTLQGDTVGTPSHMAPEQAAGRLEMVDRRTDVYGLGAMLYYLLTGQPPFRGVSVAEVLKKVETEEPIPPRHYWAEVPPTIEAACLRALSKMPSKRFDSAGELAHEVERWQEVQRKKAEEALRVSQALYHSLVESLPLCVWRKDREGRFTFANSAFSDTFGMKPEEMIGKNDADYFPDELVEKIQRDDGHVLKTGEILRITEERPPGAKGPRLVEVIKIPIRDGQGSIVGTQGIFWDMTAWKRAEEALRESEALYHSLMECTSLNVWRKDLQGRFTFANTGFCQAMGFTTDELIGKTDAEIPRFTALADKYRREDKQVIETGEQLRFLEDQILPNGEQVLLEVIKIPVRDAHGTITGTQGVFWDVAEWIKVQHETNAVRSKGTSTGQGTEG